MRFSPFLAVLSPVLRLDRGIDPMTFLPPVEIYGPRVTATKNVGKDWLKPVRNSRYRPHQGRRERDRRRRRRAEA